MRVVGKLRNSKPKMAADTTTIVSCLGVLPSQKTIQIAGNVDHSLHKNKSCTALLCELTHLKSQQKYLECNQIKLNAAHYEDQSVSGRSKNNSTLQMINEIETLKTHLGGSLKAYRENCYREVQEFRQLVSSIREDVQPHRLSQCSLPELRARIIGINTKLVHLCDKNQKDLEKLRGECEAIEGDK